MPTRASLHLLAALLLAGATLVGCGGGDAEPPPAPVGPAPAGPDTTAPTLTIANNVATPTATGPVTFTFVFSEDVGTSFDGTDITVDGGSASAFTRVGGTQATLVVTPTPGVSGTITVSVAAGSFNDLAGNTNAAAASASKDYTVAPPPPPPPPPPAGTGTVLADFGTVNPAIQGFNGAEGSTVEAPTPADTVSSGNALKIVRDGGEVFAGVTVATGNIPFAANRKTITARVYSPTAGVRFVLKAEGGPPFPNNFGTADTEASAAVVQGWQTMTWVIDSVDTARTYDRLVILPNLGVIDSPARTYYVDDIKLLDAASPPPAGDTTLADFSAVNPAIQGFNGAEGSTVEAPTPADTVSSGNALRIVRDGGEVFAGVTVATGSIPFAANRKTVTARVYSPTAGVRFVLKAEGGPPFPNNFGTADTEASAAVVQGWQTMTWVIDSVDTARTYDRLVILPNLGVIDSPARTYYVDDIKLLAASGGGGSGGGTPGPVTFSSGYTQGGATAQGGIWGYFSGDFANATNTFTGGGFADSSPALPDAAQFFFIAVTTSAPTAPSNNSGGFLGMFVTYPGATGLSIAGKTQLKINLGIDANMFQQATNKDYAVDVVGGIEYDNGSGGKCRTLLRKLVTPTTSDMITYTLDLSTFTLAQPCNGGGFTSGVTSVAGALGQGVQAVNSQLSFPNVNTTINSGTVAAPIYATGITRGLTVFE
jgi:hypothetical protein